MQWRHTLLQWLSLVTAVALANEQELIGSDGVSRYNLTLHVREFP
jgi:hypothetical protein